MAWRDSHSPAQVWQFCMLTHFVHFDAPKEVVPKSSVCFFNIGEVKSPCKYLFYYPTTMKFTMIILLQFGF